ncbi:MAG: response regulator [Sphingobium sp.]|nr:response regulator [Sphingobium sp.]
MIQRPTLSTQRIALIVDDIEDNRVLLARALKSSGYATIMASSGREALAIITEKAPDIVLLDWMMPELSGLETLRAIREMHPSSHLPVIMCTAVDEEMSVVAAINAGANDYVTKPISLPILRARMAVHLEQRATIDALDHEKASAEQKLREQTRALFNRGGNSASSSTGGGE